MKGKSFLGELRAIGKDKHLLIPIIAVMLIPILYAGMFLWAFWDPYAKLEDLPVAVVNSDNGASFEGEELYLGDELVKNLKENKQFNFHFVDKKEGYKGLDDQDYYMLVEIPKNFSSNATTILDETPKKLEMKYVPNEGYNFLSAQIGETAIEKIKSAVSEQITKTYSETIFEKIQTMADGFKSASNSANELYDGLTKVNDGTTTIKDNLATLAAKQIEFKSGVDTVYDGVAKLSSGSQELTTGLGLLSQAQGQLQSGSTEVKAGLDKVAAGSEKLNAGINTAYSKMGDLANGTAQLKDGAGQLQAGLSQLNSNASALTNGAAEISKGATALNSGLATLQSKLEPYMAALPEQAQQQLSAVLAELTKGSQNLAAGGKELANKTSTLPQAAKELYAGSQRLSTGLDSANQGASALQQGLGQLSSAGGELKNGLGQLQAGQNKVVAGMEQFGSKLGDATKGSQTLNQGLQTLSGGVTQLADGSGQLADGASKLSSGAKELSEGTVTAKDGSKEFKTALNEAADESSSVKADDQTFDMMAQPLEVEKKAVNHVPNYGTGFAPYFLSLGLFVGALLLSIVYPLVEPAIKPKNAFSWYFSKLGVLVGVGIIQALIASAILLVGLKIEVQSVPLFILFSIITSLTFITLVQFFVTCFANPGRFVAIIILILQLTTSAGTFPLELIPRPLQWFNAFLPMTYTVQGFKAAITSGNIHTLWMNVGILAIFVLLFMAGTLYYFMFKYKRTYHNMNSKEAASV